MRRIILVVFVLIVFGIVLAFALENLQAVEVHYLFGSASLPLAAILAAILVIGAVVGALTALPSILRAHTKVSRCRGRLDEAQKEIENLRRAPLRDAR